MRDATQCAPKSCQCGRRLGKPVHGYPEIEPKKIAGLEWPTQWARTFRGKIWHMPCQCKRVYVWAFHTKSNGCWMVRSPLPLMDTKEIVVIA